MEKKILVLANNSGGLYGFRQELLEKLAENNRVVASTPFDNNIEDLKKSGVRLIETKFERRGMNPIKDFSLLLKYRKIIKQENPDVAITYTIKPNIYGGIVCRLLNKTYAVNITGLGTAFQSTGMLRKMVTAMYKFALKKAKVVFFENVENKELFVNEKIIKEVQAKVLNGAGVNLQKFSVLPYPNEQNTTRFLFMGRVMAEKGVNELFSAMKRLKDEGVDCSLDMIGGFDEDYEETINQYQEAGLLKYHGFQLDVHPFIENCHCFVLPSWHEGMANTNLESAASGRPVITSNIHGCKEAVIEGESGFLFERKNADDLYKVMKKFAELPLQEKQKMGLMGRKHMEDVFDKNKVVEETIGALFK